METKTYFDYIEQALQDVSKQYLLEQHPKKGRNTVVLNAYLYAEQVSERAMALYREAQGVDSRQAKDVKMIQFMIEQGSDFVSGLGMALSAANHEDYALLVTMFPDYIKDYSERARAEG